MIHYLSNDDDTGSEFGNDGSALTKNSLKKCLLVFCDPLPLIIVSNIKSNTAGTKIAKNSTKC